MNTSTVISMATREGVNVQLVREGVVVGEYFPRAQSDRTEIDVIVGVSPGLRAEVTMLRGLTDIGMLFVGLTN